ncbi:MAG TPA: hypothetical protein VMW23_08815 [Sedimentisphaerales bacterium]|nr:hypothetical protein [Sedimentisphaerales bacterium]
MKKTIFFKRVLSAFLKNRHYPAGSLAIPVKSSDFKAIVGGSSKQAQSWFSGRPIAEVEQ